MHPHRDPNALNRSLLGLLIASLLSPTAAEITYITAYVTTVADRPPVAELPAPTADDPIVQICHAVHQHRDLWSPISWHGRQCSVDCEQQQPDLISRFTVDCLVQYPGEIGHGTTANTNNTKMLSSQLLRPLAGGLWSHRKQRPVLDAVQRHGPAAVGEHAGLGHADGAVLGKGGVFSILNYTKNCRRQKFMHPAGREEAY